MRNEAEAACMEYYLATRDLMVVEGAWATRPRDMEMGAAMNASEDYRIKRDSALRRLVLAEGRCKALGQAADERSR